MNRLKEKYIKEVVPQLVKKFGYKNSLQAPKLLKVTLNVGVGSGLKDANFIEHVEDILNRISGQHAVRTKAKKSISNFKIRQGMTVGAKVTLRGERMYEFVDKLISVTLPRVRDFRGLSPDFLDKKGNLSISFKEYICFPEISSDEVERLFGLELAITNSANSKEEGLEMFKLLGFPFDEKLKRVKSKKVKSKK